jgi:hypothetical protein
MKIDKCAENINGTPYKGDDMFRTLGKPKELSRNEMVALKNVVTDCVGIVIAIGGIIYMSIQTSANMVKSGPLLE